jgi:hypothetical protein
MVVDGVHIAHLAAMRQAQAGEIRGLYRIAHSFLL